jgi:hypothetical protein
LTAAWAILERERRFLPHQVAPRDAKGRIDMTRFIGAITTLSLAFAALAPTIALAGRRGDG